MTTFLLFLVAVVPDPGNLGSAEWSVREEWQQRYSNPISVILLPMTHENPEIAHRLKRIRAEQAQWCDPEYAERVMYRDDFKAWVKVYLVTARTRIGLRDVLMDFANSPYAKMREVFDEMPFVEVNWWCSRPTDYEYQIFLEYLDYHWQRAPLPREVEP